MSRKQALLLVLAVAGCATEPTYQEVREAARRSPTLEVCYAAVASNKQMVRTAAAEELAARGSNCQQEMPLVLARMGNDQARRAAALQFMQGQQAATQRTWQQNMQTIQSAQQQPAPPPGNQTRICSSQVVGGQLQTYCQ
jgi:hypothetical protein